MLGMNKQDISKLKLTRERIAKKREEKESLWSSISRFVFEPFFLLDSSLSLSTSGL